MIYILNKYTGSFIFLINCLHFYFIQIYRIFLHFLIQSIEQGIVFKKKSSFSEQKRQCFDLHEQNLYVNMCSHNAIVFLLYQCQCVSVFLLSSELFFCLFSSSLASPQGTLSLLFSFHLFLHSSFIICVQFILCLTFSVTCVLHSHTSGHTNTHTHAHTCSYIPFGDFHGCNDVLFFFCIFTFSKYFIVYDLKAYLLMGILILVPISLCAFRFRSPLEQETRTHTLLLVVYRDRP